MSSINVISPENTRIGWIGTGIMGYSMASHVIRAGYKTCVYSRTMEKAAGLVALGARTAESPAGVAADTDVVISIVGMPADVREVFFGNNGLLPACRAGHVFVDMATSSPALAREISGAAAAKGAFAIDAPVTGGDVGAKNATLSIMVGGDEDKARFLEPLFQVMGRNVVYHGPAGSGQHAKMCNQIVIAGTMIGVCESLVYGAAAGLDAEKIIASISRGAAGCWALDNLAPRICRGDFAPGFLVEHFIKDLGLALDECAAMNIELPGIVLAKRLYEKSAALGHGRSGTQALIFALSNM